MTEPVGADPITIITARKFVTVDERCPTATAVAVRGKRIVAVGTLDEVRSALGGEPADIDDSLADHVVLPGLIDQHLHPILAASTLATEVIATEDWVLPDRTFPAAHSHDQYLERLRAADAVIDDPDEWLFSWGYHALWHGPLDRSILDAVSATRPIGVWQRSCHEFYLNTAAIEALSITEDSMQEGSLAAAMVDLAAGHWWESGFFTLLLPFVAPVFLTPDRLVAGLEQMIQYLHQNGVTAFNEPGAALMPGLWDLYEAILGADDTPFSSSFLVDARGQAEAGVEPADCLAHAAEQIARAPGGKVSFFADQVKLFADGAIISQLMQMKDGYVDADGMPAPDHHGEWLMTPERLEERSKLYWDAGYQLHIHVNGDLGLDVVLDMLERRMRERPRPDHRSVIVHFANSTEEQIDRIARLGAIVSSNPYYPVGFADKYAEVGLGPERADTMVRNASVLERHIPLSFHSDLPMGPSDPLGMMACAVNRVTQSGRVAAPEQRVSALDALRAVTIEAAFSWRKEHELGSITPGKIANLTVVDDDPLAVDPMRLSDIEVIGTFFEGRWFPVSPASRANRRRAGVLHHWATSTTGTDTPCDHRGCACAVVRHLTRAIDAPAAPPDRPTLDRRHRPGGGGGSSSATPVDARKAAATRSAIRGIVHGSGRSGKSAPAAHASHTSAPPTSERSRRYAS